MAWWWPFRSGTPAADIFWTLRPRRRVETALARSGVRPQQRIEQLNALLAHSFRDGRPRIVVQDLYTGFRPDAERFVLLVEVEREREGRRVVRPYVVKLYLG